ncbi:acid phosphatase [Trametopsis cervina]|nr:acid phosphatase [Trametopsis cervina]
MAREKACLLPSPTVSEARPATRRLKLRAFVSIVAFGLALLCLIALPSSRDHWPHPEFLSAGVPTKVQKRWGQYAPWFPAGRYEHPPRECKITQVNILQRHGARYPDEEDSYKTAAEHLMSAKEFRDSNLQFLKHYKYQLQEEALTPFGAKQSFESGTHAFKRYAHLVTPHLLPFVRASGKGRVIDSARNWTIGFSIASDHRVHPTLEQVLSESVNNTLNNDCPNASEGEKEKNTWLSVFSPPILKRLRKAAPKANINEQDVHDLMALCPFETIALQKTSPFCSLFTANEFESFEYFGDVEKYYKTGYGNPLGPIQGVGYVNELLARLTGQPVQDKTQHNHSLPFPLDRTMYVDFTHENTQVAVFAAMGLFNVPEAPDPKKMKQSPKDREWVASRMVPFSGRMVVEKLSCESDVNEAEESQGGGEYVRIFVNDAVQPLEFCGASRTGKNKYLCPLDSFVESQSYARRNGDGDFERCYN